MYIYIYSVYIVTCSAYDTFGTVRICVCQSIKNERRYLPSLEVSKSPRVSEVLPPATCKSCVTRCQGLTEGMTSRNDCRIGSRIADHKLFWGLFSQTSRLSSPLSCQLAACATHPPIKLSMFMAPDLSALLLRNDLQKAAGRGWGMHWDGRSMLTLWNFTQRRKNVFVYRCLSHVLLTSATKLLQRSEMRWQETRVWICWIVCAVLSPNSSFGKAWFSKFHEVLPTTKTPEVKDWLRDGRCPPIEAPGTFTLCKGMYSLQKALQRRHDKKRGQFAKVCHCGALMKVFCGLPSMG